MSHDRWAKLTPKFRRTGWSRGKAHTKDIWNYRARAGKDAASSLVGYDVEALNGTIGSVIEESVAAGASHVIVDAGFWIFDMKRMIPAGAISRIDHKSGRVILSMTQAEIRDAPDFVPESGTAEGHLSYLRSLAPYYRPWVSAS